MLTNPNKSGAVVTVIGRPKSGKSPWAEAEALASGFPNLVVYDHRREHDPALFTVYYNLEKFREKLKTISDSFIIVEEATAFVTASKDMDWSDFITGIEHRRNILLMLFHSIADTPDYLIRNCQYFQLFPTNDDPEKVKYKSSRLYPFFMKPRQQVKGKDGKMWNVPIEINNNNLEVNA